ncbi:hypothetical protein V5O48_000688 [Marasmius crinis-equi]|uniref:Pre-mRNA-splicing factor 38 n=1 Tax=Marasmius crinis-equi TaxID=585013 RepID=A0ABR3G0Z2_9AGAR
MANTTIRDAKAIHGQNPQYLVETVIRNRIYEANYWKEHCFALTAESLIDKAIELKCIGGVYGNQRPTEFLCLLLKLLQIQPEKEILIEYLQADEFKYLRALAAMYIRMTFRPVEVYDILEPLLKDYRKLRLRNMAGYTLTFIDEFVDSLLTEERVCDIILPRLIKRQILEENGELNPRKSRLLDALEGRGDNEAERERSRSRSPGRTPHNGSSAPLLSSISHPILSQTMQTLPPSLPVLIYFSLAFAVVTTVTALVGLTLRILQPEFWTIPAAFAITLAYHLIVLFLARVEPHGSTRVFSWCNTVWGRVWNRSCDDGLDDITTPTWARNKSSVHSQRVLFDREWPDMERGHDQLQGETKSIVCREMAANREQQCASLELKQASGALLPMSSLFAFMNSKLVPEIIS